MYIGHYAVAFAVKKAEPRVSLGTLFIAVQLLDLLWPLFLLLGVEHVRIDPGNTAFTPLDFYDYPISHSLVTSLGWALAFGLVYYLRRRYLRGALILGLAVFSHWVLDFITHRPDLPIIPGLHMYAGLGLWNSVAGTIAVEGALFLIGVLAYARSTPAIDRTGHRAFWALIAFFAATYAAATFGPPPPNETALAIGGLAIWIFVPWGYWIDNHRASSINAR
jgi:membrane-bound metal-dependent hydrolase YbcI (DUF457 family)